MTWYCHTYKLLILLAFAQFNLYTFVHVCVYLLIYSFINQVDFGSHHCSQATEQLYNPEDPLCFPLWQSNHPPKPPLSLYPGNYESVLHFKNSIITKCYVNGIIKYEKFWNCFHLVLCTQHYSLAIYST